MVDERFMIRKHSLRTKRMSWALLPVSVLWFFMGAFVCGAAGGGPGFLIYFCELLLWAPLFILLVMLWSVCRVLLNLHSLAPSEALAQEGANGPSTASAARRLMAAPARIRHGYYKCLEEPDRKELRVQAWWLGIALTIYVLIFLKFEVLR